MLSMDATTASEYGAETTPSAAALALIAALSGTVYCRIRDENGTVVASGTMGSPWATQSQGAITVGETTLTVSEPGTPTAAWTLRFENATRWVQGSFGLSTQTADFKSTKDSWADGEIGTLGTVTLRAPVGGAPEVIGAASALSFTEGTGGTYDFSTYASDPEAGTLTYSLVGDAIAGISINSASGVLTVSSAALADVYAVTVRVRDPSGLATDWPVTITVSPAAAVAAGSGFEEFTNAYQFLASWESAYTGFVPLAYGGVVRGSHSHADCRPTVVTTPTYAGGKALKFYIPGGAASSAYFRSEVEFGTPLMECNTADYQDVEHFIGLAIYLPSDWPVSDLTGSGDPMRSVLFQQHIYTGQPGASPLWGLRTSGGQYRLTTETGSGNIDQVLVSDLTSDRGQWRRWVFHVNYSSASSGWIRVYRGVGTDPLVLLHDTSYRNTVPVGTTKLGYYKFGNYTAARQLNSGSARTHYVDAVRLMSSANGGTLAQVDPGEY